MTGEGEWPGRKFLGNTDQGRTAFNFRRRSNGIVAAFSAEERRAPGELTDRVLVLSKMQPALEAAALAY